MALEPLTYQQALADILERAPKRDQDTLRRVMEETYVASDVLAGLAATYGGWMLLTVFTVTFTELKKVIDQAEGEDKKFLQGLLEGIIGSFGKTIQ